jgi:hypothetical protein
VGQGDPRGQHQAGLIPDTVRYNVPIRESWACSATLLIPPSWSRRQRPLAPGPAGQDEGGGAREEFEGPVLSDAALSLRVGDSRCLPRPA